MTSRPLALAIVAILVVPVHARDIGQWSAVPENTWTHEIREWFRTLMQPDNPTISCCGSGDSYWCDDVYSREGHNYCRITDDRDDQSRGRKHIPIGTEFEIPNNKIKYSDRDPQLPKVNPTGHAIVFVSKNDLIFCFVPGGGV
jgi:hypothetical protein